MHPIPLSHIGRRRFLLGRQGLWPGRRWAGRAGIPAAIRQAEMIQVDPLNVVGRSHDIALTGRVLDYRPADLDAVLYEDRAFFDYGGCLFLYPIEEWPYWQLVMQGRAARGHWAEFAAAHPAVVDSVRAALRERGPLGNRDFAGTARVDNYRGSKDTGLALYYLWITGEVMTHSRRNFQRRFDFRTNLLPPALDYAAPVAEAEAFFARKLVAWLGLVTERGWARGFAGLIERPVDKAEGQARFAALLAEGTLVPVQVEGQKDLYYALAEDAPILAALDDGAVPAAWQPLATTTEEEVTFLAPLEIVSARGRAAGIFDFAYIWEVYKPAHLRRWGYYTLPILWGDKLLRPPGPQAGPRHRDTPYPGLLARRPRPRPRSGLCCCPRPWPRPLRPLPGSRTGGPGPAAPTLARPGTSVARHSSQPQLLRDMSTPSISPTARQDQMLRLIGWTLGVVGVVGYALVLLTGDVLVREGNWVGVDFHVYYQAAQVLGRGGNIYTAGLAPPYVYPPTLAALVVPLAALPVTAATIAWKVGQHLCLLLAGALLVRLLPPRVRSLAAGVLLLGLLTLPVRDEIRLGESNSLILLLEVGAFALLARSNREKAGEYTTAPPTSSHSRSPVSRPLSTVNRPLFTAGALIALAVSIKVLPVLLLGYLGLRGPRRAVVAGGGFLAIQALLLLLTPTTAYYWGTVFPDLFGQAFPYLDNQSLNAALARALLPPVEPLLPSVQLADGAALRAPLTLLVNGLVLISTALLLWRAARRSAPASALPLLHEGGLVLLTTLLVSGSTWLHHLVSLAVPIAWALARWAGRETQDSARWTTYAVPLGIALTLLVLVVRPADAVAALGSVEPGIAWLASNGPLGVVLGWWAALAWGLARRS